MTNEKVHITIELPRDYRVWDLLDLPGRIVDITGVEQSILEVSCKECGDTGEVYDTEGAGPWDCYACPRTVKARKLLDKIGEDYREARTKGGAWAREHISSDRYSVPASEALSKPGEWVRHTGTECPVHPLDVVEVKITGVLPGKPAQNWMWDKVGSADITHYRHVCDSDGIPYVYDDGSLPEWAEYVATDKDGVAFCFNDKSFVDAPQWNNVDCSIEYVTDSYANTLVPWTESLRRVWREG